MADWMPCTALDRQAPTPKRRKKRVHVGQRIARIVVLVLAIMVVALVVRKIARPFLLCYTEARSAHEIERDLRQIESENRELRRQRDFLKTKEGAQVEVRKLGWVMPGERNLVLEGPSEEKRTGSSGDDPKPTPFHRLMQRLTH